MSNSSTAVNARGVPIAAHGETLNNTRNNRSERSTGKGRRRRAAAEQRRIEQQRWGQYVADGETDDFAVAPSAANRRRASRSSRRRNWGQEGSDESFNEMLAEDSLNDQLAFTEEFEVDVALALALSLSDNSSTNPQRSSGSTTIDLSYENLVLLEDVKVVAPSSVVESLQSLHFEGIQNQPLSEADSARLCIVCQCEYETADKLIVLPCCHNFHHACGSEWLLNYSKLCPVCKHDVTE